MTNIVAHDFDHPDRVRERERLWRQRDEDERRSVENQQEINIPPLLLDAVRYHEAGHCVVAELLGFNIERVEVTSDLRGHTRGVVHDGTGLGAICAMITLAAGRAAQRKFGARAFDDWAQDDDKKLAAVACSLVNEKDAAIRLIEGAEQTAEQMVNAQWDEIQLIALALERMGGVVERDSIKRFLRNMPRIDINRALSRSAAQGEGTVDGCEYRWRQDGYLKPIRH
jgi:hypothetical protein